MPLRELDPLEELLAREVIEITPQDRRPKARPRQKGGL
jgi:hypothetical protein